MTISKQDKIFLALLPAICAAAAYWFLVAKPQAQIMRRQTAELKQMPPIEEIKIQTEVLQMENARLREQNERRAAEIAARANSKRSTAQRVAEINTLFRTNKIAVAAANFSAPTSGGYRVWDVTLKANYENMLSALTELAEKRDDVCVDSIRFEPTRLPNKPLFWTIKISL